MRLDGRLESYFQLSTESEPLLAKYCMYKWTNLLAQIIENDNYFKILDMV